MSTAEPTSKQTAIMEQIEFYLSNSNLSKDRYVRNLIKKNDQRWIALTQFTKFNKIKALTTDIEEIVTALRMSSMLELTEDGKMVRRKTPYEKVSNEVLQARTVYAENLPLDAKHEDVKAVFSAFGTVEYISLPQIQVRPGPEGEKAKLNKGFAFVEFGSEEAATKAIEASGSIKFEIEQGEDAAAEVARLVKAFEAEGDELITLLVGETFGKPVQAHSKDVWQKLKNDALYFKEEAEEGAMTPAQRRTALCRRAQMHFVPGALLRVDGVQAKQGGKWIRDKLAEVAPVMYADKQRGDSHAVVQCFRPEAAKYLVTENEKFPFTLTLLNEEEETEYLKTVITRKYNGNKNNNNKNNNNNNNKNKRKNVKEGEETEEANAGDGPEQKKAKTDEE